MNEPDFPGEILAGRPREFERLGQLLSEDILRNSCLRPEALEGLLVLLDEAETYNDMNIYAILGSFMFSKELIDRNSYHEIACTISQFRDLEIKGNTAAVIGDFLFKMSAFHNDFHYLDEIISRPSLKQVKTFIDESLELGFYERKL